MSGAEITHDGLLRAMGLDPGPAQAISAVYVMEPDGERCPAAFVPDPEPVRGGRTSLIVMAPRGGGTVRSIELNAEDGVTIIRVGGPYILREGDAVTIPLEVGL